MMRLYVQIPGHTQVPSRANQIQVEVRDRQGAWKPMDLRLDSLDYDRGHVPGSLIFYMPMRKDGFPSDHQEDELFVPSGQKTGHRMGTGDFLARVSFVHTFTDLDQEIVEQRVTSDPVPIQIQPQVYAMTDDDAIGSQVFGGTKPGPRVWLAHMTAKSEDRVNRASSPSKQPRDSQGLTTLGPTIQLSSLRLASEPSQLQFPGTALTPLAWEWLWAFGDEDVEHTTSPALMNTLVDVTHHRCQQTTSFRDPTQWHIDDCRAACQTTDGAVITECPPFRQGDHDSAGVSYRNGDVYRCLHTHLDTTDHWYYAVPPGTHNTGRTADPISDHNVYGFRLGFEGTLCREGDECADILYGDRGPRWRHDYQPVGFDFVYD
jgi:hypothetical protein